ncbi:hypothetical protein OSB04_018467 [Centaurea solstitialis]|uniref:Uncharacterized protein n=1 Tax=Centaurea solstitialis TaxID=347529 RepID=A0AA38WAI9_9ASTR|nr:hypothetical protein OSB04_018467 [Centaurea solstitialis]
MYADHAWRLHKEGKSLDLIDASFGTSWSYSEVLRLRHIALLCVQQRAEDRPNIQSVVHMLGSEEPGVFIQSNRSYSASILPSPLSVNGVTLSQIDGARTARCARYPRPHWAQTNPQQFWVEARLLKHAAQGRNPWAVY